MPTNPLQDLALKNYYVNDTAQNKGDHEVHVEECYWLSIARSRTPLGAYYSCHSAVIRAKAIYPTANGCAHCSPDCNTG